MSFAQSFAFTPPGCDNCLHDNPLDFEITMAFQPIVDMRDRTILAYEALVRGTHGEGAAEVLSRVNESNRYTFDQSCRIKAIELAAELQIDCYLSINFLPNAVYRPEACIRATVAAAEYYHFPLEATIFEVSESERVIDPHHLQNIFNEYKNRGLMTAIDDFGAGFSDLQLLSRFQPHFLKLDIALCRGIAQDPKLYQKTATIIATAQAMKIEVIAEGIENLADLELLMALGLYYFQGYLFARPATEALPEVDFS
ncbi:EAL domain-containing protein [Ectothiorhodospiraceae bacterium BW-2]|nr:EAL domain-containing protein [Ectothiorhodospiraceae bacterium BW-2]